MRLLGYNKERRCQKCNSKYVAKCFNYKNLQPLWRKENSQKSGKVILYETIEN